MKAIAYGLFLRFLVACWPLVWDASSLDAWRAIHRKALRRGGGAEC